MSGFDFIEYLESSGILKQTVTKKLRKQIKSSSKSISAKSLAKLLIKKEVLTRDQAVMALKDYGRKSGILEGLEILPEESVDEPEVLEAVPAMQTVTKEEAYGADPFAVAEQDAQEEAAKREKRIREEATTEATKALKAEVDQAQEAKTKAECEKQAGQGASDLSLTSGSTFRVALLMSRLPGL